MERGGDLNKGNSKKVKVLNRDGSILRNEEVYAQHLFLKLKKHFHQNSSVKVSVEGSGVHWKCTVSKNNISCKIHCFSTIKTRKAEYLIYFQKGSWRWKASGRTQIQENVISSAEVWLLDGNVNILHQAFEFVDQRRRRFRYLELALIEIYPELATMTEHGIISDDVSDICYLRFDTEMRSCHFKFWGENKVPDAFFDWDHSTLLKIQIENTEELSLAAKRWLCDLATPSEMAKEFSWFEVNKLAKHYEEGRAVEGEFLVSWDSIETFYEKLVHKYGYSPNILKLINEMKELKLNHHLRAGQSMSKMILSRLYRPHGLGREQPMLWFSFPKDGSALDVYTSNSDEPEYQNDSFELTPELKRLLEELRDEPIS